MSLNMLLPADYVREKFLRPAGLPERLLDQIPVERWGGVNNHLPLYGVATVRSFLKEHRPKKLAGESYEIPEDLEMVAIGNPGREKSGPLLKTKQAAQYLAIGERQLQYEVGRGNIRCVRFGKNCIRFSQEDLDEYVNRHRTGCPAVGGG